MTDSKLFQQIKEHPLYFISFLLLAIPLFYLSYEFNKANEEEIRFAEKESKGMDSLLALDHSYISRRNIFLDQIGSGKSPVPRMDPFAEFQSSRDIVLDDSNLILDPQKETYHLIVASQKLAYDIEESLIKIYSGRLEIISTQSDNRMDISLALSLVQDKITEAAKSYRKFCSVSCPSHFETGFSKYESQLMNFINSISAEKKAISREEKFRQLKHALEISDNVRLQSSSLISQKLNKRIDKYYFRQRSVLIATFILWLASMVCSYVFYLFNLKRIRNYILQIQDQNEELERVKKLSLLGELAAGIGHEINNPLTIAQLSLEFINRYVEKCQESMEPQAHEDIKNMIVRIDKMILNIRQIIRSFKSFAYNGDDEKISYISLNEAISDSLLLVQYKAFAHGVHITNKIKDDIKVLGTLHGIEQVFVNLINNAIDAMENINEKKVLIEASLQGEFAMIDVSDKGPGISPNLHEKIFKPLFTTKNLSNGTGLGLGLAKKICTKYGGDLVLVDSNKGAKFRVKLKIT